MTCGVRTPRVRVVGGFSRQIRSNSLFDPAHPGWFTSPLAAKDLGLVLGLAPDDTRLPVTQAALESYLLTDREGWGETDITAIVEL